MADTQVVSRPHVIVTVKTGANVTLYFDELPENVDELIGFLSENIPPLQSWMDIALAYFKRGYPKKFKKMLLKVTATELLDSAYRNESESARIMMLNSLAAYWVNKGMRARDPAKRSDILARATACYNRSDRISVRDYTTWIGKGVLLLAMKDLTRADHHFKTVLDAEPQNTGALLGRACIEFQKREYDKALATYKNIITTNPSCPPNVRMGLAMCYYRLGKLDLTTQAFARVLQLQPKNVNALVGQAVLALNAGSIQPAMQLLKIAYQSDSTNPMVLNHLADHFFFKKDYAMVQKLASAACNMVEESGTDSDANKVKAHSFYLMARAFHAQEQYENAFNFYNYAVHNWADFPLPQYGLGQLWLWKGNIEKSVECFEKVLKMAPDNYETLKILGCLYAQQKKREQAAKCLRKVTELHPEDVPALLELANVYCSEDPLKALNLYNNAVRILESQGEAITSEIWNNLGVLNHQLGHLVEAEKSYMKAIELSGFKVEDFKAANVSVTYNLARLYETQFLCHKAEALYKGIIKEHPNYVDCYIRLGVMAREKGLAGEAVDWFKEVFVVNRNHPDAWSLLGCLHLDRHEWLPAQKKFERIVQQEESLNDIYSLVALGNMYYAAKFEKKDKAERYLKLAFDFFAKVLKMDHSNIYAANGLGMVMAEKGDLTLAKQIFTQVRESNIEIPDAWINLGHVFMMQRHYENAIDMYESCWKKFYVNCPDIHLLANYCAGKLDKCIEILSSAVHNAPHNFSLWYNLALAHHEIAAMAVSAKGNIQLLRQSIRNLQTAHSLFSWLAKVKPTNVRFKHDPKQAEKHANACASLLESANGQLAVLETEEESELKLRHEARDRELAEIEQKKQLLELQKQEEAKRKEEEKKLAEESLQRQQDLAERWSSSKVEEEAAKAAKEMPVEDGQDAGRSKTAKKKKGEHSRKRKKADKDDSDDDDQDKKKRKTEEDGNEESHKHHRHHRKHHHRRKSSDEEEDEEEGEEDVEEEQEQELPRKRLRKGAAVQESAQDEELNLDLPQSVESTSEPKAENAEVEHPTEMELFGEDPGEGQEPAPTAISTVEKQEEPVVQPQSEPVTEHSDISTSVV